MALKIRMRQQGRKNKRVYRLVLTDSKTPRDGKYLESLGWYNPHETTDAKKVSVEESKIQEWLGKGAQLSEKARSLLAKIAPGVIKSLREKELARKQKRTAKRRAARKKRAETRKEVPAKKAAAPKASAKAPAKKAAPKAKASATKVEDKAKEKKADAPKADAKKEEKTSE